MPINGLTSASGALRYWERRQEVTANNLANVSTDGFKAERAFASLIDGAPDLATHIDRKVGNLRHTGDAFDVALGNDSFVVVSTEAGERYSRGGHLTVDKQGYLADSEGRQLLGKDGHIKVGDAKFEVDTHGVVSVGGKPIETLRVETSPASETLLHEGGMLLVPGATRNSVALTDRDVRQGSIEESNVDSLGGLVDMISVQRAYAAVEKSITMLDHIRETATNQLGKPVA